MMIRRKIFDTFVQQGVTKQFFEQQINDMTFRCREESPVWFSVQRNRGNGTGTILRANIHWMLPYEDHSPSPTSKDFPDSWGGALFRLVNGLTTDDWSLLNLCFENVNLY